MTREQRLELACEIALKTVEGRDEGFIMIGPLAENLWLSKLLKIALQKRVGPRKAAQLERIREMRRRVS